MTWPGLENASRLFVKDWKGINSMAFRKRSPSEAVSAKSTKPSKSLSTWALIRVMPTKWCAARFSARHGQHRPGRGLRQGRRAREAEAAGPISSARKT